MYPGKFALMVLLLLISSLIFSGSSFEGRKALVDAMKVELGVI